MPKLKALTPQRFGRRTLVVGECFEASDQETKILLALNRAELVHGYQTRVMTAGEPSTSIQTKGPRVKRDPNKPKRKYQRRNLQAKA